MNGNGSGVKVTPEEYYEVLPVPSTRHKCVICGKPAQYQSRRGAGWICRACYIHICDRSTDDEGEQIKEYRVKVITNYSGEDRLIHLQHTIRQGIQKGFDREKILAEVRYDNEYMYEPLFTPMELQEVFDTEYIAALEGSNQQVGDVEAVIAEGAAGKQAYRNSLKHGIVLYKVRGSANGPLENIEYIFAYRIRTIERIENPADNADVCYNIIFEDPERPRKRIRYDEMTINQIANDITSTKSGVKNKQRVHEAISALIDEYESRELIKLSARIPATGFFEDGEGILKYHENKRFKPNLPKHEREKAIAALGYLDEIMLFHSHSDRALAVLYQTVFSPLGFIRKTYGKENKMVLAYGEPHTGKTYLCRICGYFWGVSENECIINGASLTAPQLAEHLNKTTFMITLDESRNILGDRTVVEMLKGSTVNTRIKDRIRPEQGFRIESKYAYATVALTTNYLPQLYVGMQDRLIPSEWTLEAKRSDEDVKQFEEMVSAHREDLAYIGAALKEMFLERWPAIRPILYNSDQMIVGMEILKKLYQYLGIPVPGWVQAITTTYEIDTPDPVMVLFGYMRETYLERIRLYDKSSLDPEMDIPWSRKLQRMHEIGISPSHTLSITDKYIVVTTAIIQEIALKGGYEMPGGLKSLMFRIPGAKYQTYKKTKALMIPTESFLEHLIPLMLGEEDI